MLIAFRAGFRPRPRNYLGTSLNLLRETVNAPVKSLAFAAVLLSTASSPLFAAEDAKLPPAADAKVDYVKEELSVWMVSIHLLLVKALLHMNSWEK